MDADVIVVGGGVVGLWTAYHLRKQGVKTILFEQFPYPHTRGSSHGQSRLTRNSYVAKEYAALLPESNRKWRELERECGTELLVEADVITLFDFKKDKQRFLKFVENLEDNKVTHYVIPGDSIHKRFPGFTAHSDLKGVLDKEAGILRADKCTQALRDCFVSCGGQLHESEPVVSIHPMNDSKVEVVTDVKTYTCSSVVLTCGTYINNILATLDFKIPVEPTRVVVTYWKDKSADRKYSWKNGFPLTRVHLGSTRMYTLPAYEYPGLMKICWHSGTACDPMNRDTMTSDARSQSIKNMEFLKKGIKIFYPEIDADAPAITEVCMYTCSPDDKYILDSHPKYKNIVIGSGLSGHGFKSSPAVGHILANMAIGLQPPYKIEPFSLKRFKKDAKL